MEPSRLGGVFSFRLSQTYTKYIQVATKVTNLHEPRQGEVDRAKAGPITNMAGSVGARSGREADRLRTGLGRGSPARAALLLSALPGARPGIGPDLRGDLALLLGRGALGRPGAAVEPPGGGQDLIRAAGPG